jgi:hypothetical protein
LRCRLWFPAQKIIPADSPFYLGFDEDNEKKKGKLCIFEDE